MLKIALTGGIASGKSTIASLFESLGSALIYADKISREVVAPGSQGLEAVRATFGDKILNNANELDRGVLRELIFADPLKRKKLESILHPLIRARSDELEQAYRDAGTAYVIFEIPLLLETCRHADMDRVIVVDVAVSTQISRIIDRDGCDEVQARQILAAQSTREERLAIADDVVSNDGLAVDLKAVVLGLHRGYLKMARDSERG